MKDKTKNLNICYIGGGSRGWAWVFMQDLQMEKELGGTITLYDIDHKAARINEHIGNANTNNFRYRVKTNLKDALTGADFVVISILPGTFDEMESDVHTPEKYGIYQSVGDTAGPGGMIRALRTIPMIKEIAQAVKLYAPEAWVINYTNPMSLCVKTLYDTYPEIKAFGCCHEVFNTQDVLVKILEKELEIKKIKREEITTNVMGINHFTWFSSASYKDIDIFPIYRKYIKNHFREGLEYTSDNWMNSYFGCAHRVKFDLFNRYGLIAAAGDRHLVEFMPGNEYLKNPETVESWKFSLTPVSWRKKDLEKRLIKSKKLFEGKLSIPKKNTGEEGVQLIKAILGLHNKVSNVNIPNYAHQIPNLPDDAIVETNALFSYDSIQPVYAGKLPEEIRKLILPHIENHKRIYKAATTYNRDLVKEAFRHDPLIKGRINNKDIGNLVDEMIDNTMKYLPKEWKKK